MSSFYQVRGRRRGGGLKNLRTPSLFQQNFISQEKYIFRDWLLLEEEERGNFDADTFEPDQTHIIGF